MKILVVGSGGREHAIVWKLCKSQRVSSIYCAPGNAGTAEIAQNVDISADDVEGLLGFAKEKGIDLTIVGPEVALVMGITDMFEAEGLKIFGPDKMCSRLEGSKAFSKEFMIRNNIPTGKYEEYTDFDEAVKNVDKFGYPIVIKADGLAAGKGVLIETERVEAVKDLENIMLSKVFGESGKKVVIEEFLSGIEASILCFVDGKTIVPMTSAQDYKKIFDDDMGPNTGGMGSYSPSMIYDEELSNRVEREILTPIIDGFKNEGMNFKGILFVGLMIGSEGPKVLEFNVRFGDPETQSVLTRLETDLVDIIESIIEGRLDQQEIKWSDKKTVCVGMASKGYPGMYEKGKEITGFDKVDSDVMVFHAGTRLEDGKVLTNGGRVLGVTAYGESIEEARNKAYENVRKIQFEGAQYRSDIGKIIGR
ncbi:phosphoribosylamine--glycine ligase [Peptoclostridium litorale DSM 5388]|uniref:Phosphoribosylamine--glycine ligase n=1 Tax=Peptoclostridium litorale DSM 5388 TaxID=1121324 RepID=A0A069RJG0_PEPLI|nr:phosphoribosylamine--glycine ligase [Peptoclostridium litorale]KDR94397.1 phosphoribosylamine--glycine ligase PurD [Peptoclostridium litorale DSM 5388]SIO24556.1 phosphoribosylamine--glycine ligase [Peptoclostridium litorale DSM 5388]